MEDYTHKGRTTVEGLIRVQGRCRNREDTEVFLVPLEDTMSLTYILFDSWLDMATLSLLQAQWICSASPVVMAEANFLLG